MHDTAGPFLWVGNLPCLDFINTEKIADGERVSLVDGFGAVVRWLGEAGLLADSAARAALERWDGRAEGQAAYRQALALRHAARRTVERLTEGKTPAGDDIDLVNRILAERVTHPSLARKGGGYLLTQVPERETALQLLAPVAESIAWLLTAGDLSLLRRCENPDCILYFYDVTRNGRRRWCSMAGGGSRAKAAAYYRRQRSGKRRA